MAVHIGATKEAEFENVEEGLRLTQKWEKTDSYDGEVWSNIPNTYALLGDKEGCIRALKRTIEGGFFCYSCMINDPLLKFMIDGHNVKKFLELAKSKHKAFEKKFLQTYNS
jgi:hypothetical protein